MLLTNGTVLTVDADDRVIEDGAVLIQRGRIVDVGPADQLRARHSAEKQIDVHGDLILPGLINAHSHSLYYLTRGLGMDGSLLEWLARYVAPFSLAMSEKDAYLGALLSFLENLRMGSTCVVDNFYAPGTRKHNADAVAEAAVDAGIRVLLARCYADKAGRLPQEFEEAPRDIVREYERLINRWHGDADGKIQVCVAPVTLPSCSSESIRQVHGLADAHELVLHTHCAETRESVEAVTAEYGRRFVEVFADLGVLGPRFHCVHGVWLSKREQCLLAEAGAKVVHNPVANMLLGEGIAAVVAMRSAGLTVALGTDSPNNRQDMIETMKTATLLQRVDALDSNALSARSVLRMATIDGARTLGMEEELGSIEVGKKADLIIVDMARFHNVPHHDPISTLVYSATGRDVKTVIVDGQIELKDGILTRWDEKTICREVNGLGKNLRTKAEAFRRSAVALTDAAVSPRSSTERRFRSASTQ